MWILCVTVNSIFCGPLVSDSWMQWCGWLHSVRYVVSVFDVSFYSNYSGIFWLSARIFAKIKLFSFSLANNRILNKEDITTRNRFQVGIHLYFNTNVICLKWIKQCWEWLNSRGGFFCDLNLAWIHKPNLLWKWSSLLSPDHPHATGCHLSCWEKQGKLKCLQLPGPL